MMARSMGEISASLRSSSGVMRASSAAASRTQPVAGTRATMDVRLEPGGVLRGVVVDPDGEPVPAATAFAFPEAWREVRWDPLVRSGNEEARRVETDAAGRFEVEGLPLGVPLCATARGEQFARALDACGVTLSETAGEANVSLRLRRPASVEITLRDPEGAPVTRPTTGTLVLTPHDGEAEALAGQRPGPDRFEAVRALAASTGAVVLLKGPTTLVADPEGKVLADTRGGQPDITADDVDALALEIP